MEGKSQQDLPGMREGVPSNSDQTSLKADKMRSEVDHRFDCVCHLFILHVTFMV